MKLTPPPRQGGQATGDGITTGQSADGAQFMWQCQCGGQNLSQHKWCSGCGMYYTQVRFWEISSRSPTTPKWKGARARSASTTRKTKGQKGKGQQKGKNYKGERSEKEAKKGSYALFQPFTETPTEPWVATTPSSRIPKNQAAASTLGKDGNQKDKQEEMESVEDLEAQEHAKAILENTQLPAELRQALQKYTSKEPSEVTHADLNRLKRLKLAIQKGKDRITSLENTWMEFQKSSRMNWYAQQKRFLELRQEALETLQEQQERLGTLQQSLALKTAQEETEEDQEIPDNEAFLEGQELPPWEIEIPDDDNNMEEEEEKPNALQPFGRPPKKLKKGK